jgi:restriction system protein
MKTSAEIAIGRITGDYMFRSEARPGFRHVRPVQWLRTDLARNVVRQDLLDSMGSLLTVCRLERFDAAARIAHLAEHGIDSGPGGGEDPGLEVSSTRELAARASSAKAGEPFRLSIRQLLSCWGAVRRSPGVVARIEADLVELGLTTRPPFTEGWIDSQIEVVVVGEEPGEPATDAADRAIGAEDAADFPPITLRIDVLPSANKGISSVHPDDDVRLAITRMIALNYSQLGVIDEHDELRGVISWESIGKAQIAGPVATVSSATTVARIADHDEDLLSQIDEIYRNGYVFVRAADRTISGIVTASDLTMQFGELARPLVLIEEAERRLRRRMDEVFTTEEFMAFSSNRAKSAAGLTIGNYKHALSKSENWERLGWPLDHESFTQHLEEVRRTRNEFMHFSPDPLNDVQMSWLEGFVRILRTVDPRP